MALWRVLVEDWQYYGVYVEAETEEEAEAIVEEKLEEGDVEYDDEGDSGVRVCDGCAEKAVRKGLLESGVYFE